jgi:hypothetical protein
MNSVSFKWPAKFDTDLGSEIELAEPQLNWLLEGYSVIGHQALVFQSKIT